MAEGMLSLSWNNHSSTFCQMLSALREVERYTDVTVACEGKFYPVHKLVLSTCSDYFLKMFECTPCKHPIIVLKDVKCKDMEALLSYMYAGIVSVAQSDLAQLIKAAELLQIKGLAVPDEVAFSNRKVRSMTDSSNSPHPKRHKRHDYCKEESQSIEVTSPFSPDYGDGDQQDRTDASVESETVNQNSFQEEEHTLENIEICQVRSNKDNTSVSPAENRGENKTSSQVCPTSNDEAMLDETMVKEEMVDEENCIGVTTTEFDYSTLGSDVGDDNEAEDDYSNLAVHSKYEQPCHNQSFLQRQFQPSEASSEIQPGPLLLQGWQNLSEVGEGTAGQGFSSDVNQEASLTGHMDSQPLYPLVSMTTDGQGTSGEGASEVEKSHSDVHDMQHNSFCYCFNSKKNISIQTNYMAMGKKNKKPYSCAQCQYATASKSNLIIHLRTHTGERPYSCPECSFTASFEYNLKVHMRTHTGEKPYTCPSCPLKFAQKAHLKNHLFTHTGEKPFSCQLCSAKFSRRSNLRRHIRTHQ
ncbi:zinc finger and BTB domain-containing protein 7A isoform X1 [Procambarus clarkii]|uniref:zinc finger and BTB domain-containing protein 7A isoform X1 n=1 Tax=Procambarus clarkii TaxID=6728 RepID=UPI001E677E8B|nr:zinc finger protein 615-like isoform X1 [Procambarus clarkii]XP_045582831.1 zinc finger protein 615-like isoform X1 [Procambarus clarkii]XP_045582832.1 zinc finger protein 615-like isoform X1 [Procambarus clarkii]XP_045582834.1 zinc finger protein 615-like isoform X1 [Procambarus clarkii]XP_045582835.1 zinc finger protein 615-like isoform X1 [Procambarus clarkii]